MSGEGASIKAEKRYVSWIYSRMAFEKLVENLSAEKTPEGWPIRLDDTFPWLKIKKTYQWNEFLPEKLGSAKKKWNREPSDITEKPFW